MVAIQPKKAASTTKKPSRAPKLVPTTKYVPPINTTTDRAILKDNELIISINPVNNQAAGVLKLLTSDAIRFTGFFTYAGKEQPEANTALEYYDNE
jgi:hypothetical protein